MTGNAVRDGKGYGILCRGPATLQRVGLAANTFAGNARPEVFGCP